MFEIVRQVENSDININELTVTKHMIDRLYRVQFNKQYLNDKSIYKVFLVNTNHSNGLELHVILKNASILILNNNTKKLVTVLNARKNQILRYDRKAPKFLLRMAMENQRLKRNY